jgi:hypothetical protein
MANRNIEDRYSNATDAIEDIKRFQRKRPGLPPSYVKALAKTVENINDIKRRVKEEKLATPKAKRTLWLAMMGEPVNADGSPANPEETYVPQQAEISEYGVSQEIRDSVSARNRAKSRSSGRRGPSRNLIYISAGVVALLVLVTGIQLSRRAALSAAKSDSGGSEMPSQFVHLTAPIDRQLIWLEKGLGITFGWSQPLNNGDYVLQVAWDKDFNSVVINEPVTSMSYRVTSNLSEGEYFWRLLPVRNTALPALGPLHFSISSMNPVELSQPPSGQQMEVKAGEALSVDLAWNCKTSAQKYRVQLSNDGEFKTLLDERVLPTCAWPQLHLLAGNYYWRVLVEEPSSPKPLWSRPSSFFIKVQAQAAPALASAPASESKRPDMVEPDLLERKSVVVLRFLKANSSRETASPHRLIENPPELSWAKVKNAHSYRLQISPLTDFSRLVLSTEVDNLKYVWQDVIPGSFYWRVRAQGPGSQHSGYSAVGSLKVQLPTPNLTSDFSISPEGVLEWRAVPMAQKYIVQASTERSMASVTEKQTALPQFKTQISDKTQYVRVAAANAEGERVSEYSAPVTLETESETLPAVTLKTPKEGAKVRVGASGKISVIFSWTQVQNAVSYEIQIAYDEQFSKKVDQKIQPGHLYVLKEAHLKGHVFWRVRAMSKSGPGTWSAIAHFGVQ